MYQTLHSLIFEKFNLKYKARRRVKTVFFVT